MTYTLGIDISKYQGSMDFAKAKAAGAQFAFIRAGGAYKDSAQPFTDDRYLENVDKCKSENFPYSLYWYFVPKNVPAQADHYLSLLNDWKFPPAMDCEYDAGLGSVACSDAIEQFLNLVEPGCGDTLTIYTRASWWNTETVSRPTFANRDLWIARYAALDHPWGDGAYKPRDWNDWRFWQCTSQGTGATYGASSAYIDLNYFNGDLTAFRQYAGIPTTDYPYIARVTGPDGCIVRALPNGGTLLRVEPNGAHLGILGAAEDVDGAVWLDTGAGYVRETAVTKT